MKTKTAFFALLNDKENRIGATAHVAMHTDGNGNGNPSVIIRQNKAPNAWLSSHRSAATAAAAGDRYQAWLNEWFMAQTPAAPAGKPVNIQTVDAAVEHLERMKAMNGGELSISETFTLAAFEQLFTALCDQQTQAETAKRFRETERMACINMGHISRRNLVSLNMAEDWWILSTGFGFIVRFEAAVRTWEEQDDTSILHPFKRAGLDDTFAALCLEMREAGFQVIHLDADGPSVEGLHAYEH